MVCMLLDHIFVTFGYFLFYGTPLEAVIATPWSDWMRYLGRLAFPIFAFCLAEGCRKTRSMPRYIGRLVLFGAISQIPYTLALDNYQRLVSDEAPLVLWTGELNVMFTLALGALAVYCWEKGRAGRNLWYIAVIVCCAAGEILHCDYGIWGVLLIFCVYQFSSLGGKVLSVAGFSVLNYMVDWYHLGRLLFETRVFRPKLVAKAAFPFLTYPFPYSLTAWLPAIMTCASLIPICLYDGKRGNMKRWTCYLFYPAHLLVLGMIREIAVYQQWFA